MAKLLFFYFSGVIIGSSILVITLRNSIYSALSLLVTFIHIAGLYVLLNAEFIAAIQVIVYAGAILILYLFVVMLFNIKAGESYQQQVVVGVMVGLVVLAEAIYIVSRSVFGKGIPPAAQSLHAPMGNTEAIGQMLYTQYLFPFEVASLILLVAMIGAIMLAKKS